MSNDFYIGTFDAEKYWREKELALLPSIRDTNAESIVSTLDELQFVFCSNESDILYTRYKLGDIQVDYLKEIGILFKNEFLYKDILELNKSYDNVCNLMINSLRVDHYDFFNRNLIFSAYAIDKYSLAFCEKYGFNYDFPNHKVVKEVNSKLFAFDIQKSILPTYEGRIVDSASLLLHAGLEMLKSIGSFLIKDSFGVSGNGNLLIESENILNNIYRYLLKQENTGKIVSFILEPLYEKETDFSCQLEILKNGEIKLISVQIMQNKSFSFAGISEANNNFYEYLQNNNYYTFIDNVAKQMYSSGYYGPVCIDSMTLKDGNVIPLIEINARKSMGFINAWLKKRIPDCKNTFLMTYSLIIPVNVSYDHFINKLECKKILFYPKTGFGLIPLTSNAFLINRNNAVNGNYKGRIYIGFIFENESRKKHLIKELEIVFSELNIKNQT